MPDRELRNALASFGLPGALATRPIGALSGGERFRVALAALLLAEPAHQLVVLDEPTNNLDLDTARVLVEGQVVGELGRPGLVALVAITHDDTEQIVQRMAEKTWSLRIFEGELSASDLAAPILVVSQFTLYAETRKGRRPSWSAAAPGATSEPLVAAYARALTRLGAEVSCGVFGAHMQVELVNDGPVTIILDSADWGG